MELYSRLILGAGIICTGEVGDYEVMTSVVMESLLGYHPCVIGFLTIGRKPVMGHCQVGSLTGAVASESVSEALKGSLRMVGNHSKSAKA